MKKSVMMILALVAASTPAAACFGPADCSAEQYMQDSRARRDRQEMENELSNMRNRMDMERSQQELSNMNHSGY